MNRIQEAALELAKKNNHNLLSLYEAYLVTLAELNEANGANPDDTNAALLIFGTAFGMKYPEMAFKILNTKEGSGGSILDSIAFIETVKATYKLLSDFEEMI